MRERANRSTCYGVLSGPGQQHPGERPRLMCLQIRKEADVSEVYTGNKEGREWLTRDWKTMRSPQFHSQGYA